MGTGVPANPATDPPAAGATPRPWFDRGVAPMRPATLGGIRFVTCATLLVWLLREDIGQSARLPRGLMHFQNAELLRLATELPGVRAVLDSELALDSIEWVTAIALVLGAVGLFTRLALPVAAVGLLFLGAVLRAYTHYFHTGLAPLYVLMLLCVLDAGAGLSADRFRRVARGRPVADGDRATAYFGWATLLCWAAIALPYVAAGLAKFYIGGVEWFRPDSLRQTILFDTLRKPPWDTGLGLTAVHWPGLVFVVMAIGAVATELGMGLVLVSGPIRRVMPVCAAAMHVGIAVLQKVMFLDLILIQAVFYLDLPWVRRVERALDAAAARRAGAGEIARAPGRASPGLLPWLGAACLVVGAAAVYRGTENYPVSAWPMYAKPATQYGTVGRTRYWALDATGERLPFYAEDINAVWRDTRDQDLHRYAGRRWFDQVALEAFWRQCGEYLNAGRPDDRRIVGIVIESHRWPYREAPDDPTHGYLTRRYTYRFDHPGCEVEEFDPPPR